MKNIYYFAPCENKYNKCRVYELNTNPDYPDAPPAILPKANIIPRGNASAIPVLPDVGSTIVELGFSFPLFSAFSITSLKCAEDSDTIVINAETSHPIFLVSIKVVWRPNFML